MFCIPVLLRGTSNLLVLAKCNCDNQNYNITEKIQFRSQPIISTKLLR